MNKEETLLNQRKTRLEALERFIFCDCDGIKFSEEQKAKLRGANEMLLDLIEECYEK